MCQPTPTNQFPYLSGDCEGECSCYSRPPCGSKCFGPKGEPGICEPKSAKAISIPLGDCEGECSCIATTLPPCKSPCTGLQGEPGMCQPTLQTNFHIYLEIVMENVAATLYLLVGPSVKDRKENLVFAKPGILVFGRLPWEIVKVTVNVF